MGTTVMFIVMAVLLFTGVPIGISLACSMLALLMVNPVTTYEFVAQSLYSGLDNFTLLALPFFMIAGAIMEVGGISKRLVRVANSIVGNVTGSLGLVTIITCMLFGAVSGSAIATVAAIGSIMLPEMVHAGYSKHYATALVAVAGGLGVIVPPSTPMVVYGVTNNVSIGALFMGGFCPALVVGGLLMIVNYFICKNRGYIGTGHKVSLIGALKAFWDAKWALLMPIIILGGIYTGVFTPTEASVASCTYGIIIGLFVYKELTLKKLWELYKSNTSFIGGMLFTFAPAAALGAIFSYLKIPTAVTQFFISISNEPAVILFMIFMLLILVGMFLQTTPAILLISPILLAVVSEVGVNPVHFGVFMVVALALGFVTPPVAMNLFVAQSMTGISMMTIARHAIPFMIALFIATVIIMYVPGVTLCLLDILGIVY